MTPFEKADVLFGEHFGQYHEDERDRHIFRVAYAAAWNASRSAALDEAKILVRAVRQKRHGPTREYTTADEAADAIAKLKTATRGGE